jgi:C-terminal processing protease CtpA/Prc
MKLRALFALALCACLMSVVANDAAARQAPREQPDASVDDAARREVVESLVKRLNDMYVFPKVAAEMEQAVRARLGRGEYDRLTGAREFAEKLTADIQEVSRDKHLRVRYSPTGGPREPRRRDVSSNSYGFHKVERLPGNIGYVELLNFLGAEGGAAKVASVFNSLADTDALIFDLRRNGGGEPEMVALICSYLFGPEPVHLNSLHWRAGDRERVEEFWTHREVAGRRYTGKDVYVLTSGRTFSGAEEFTYNLKNLKRATVVGETTGGGANPGDTIRLSNHFSAFIPTGRAVSPVTKTNWEGTGVEPDVKVPADRALRTAQLMALKKALDKTADDKLKGALRREIDVLQNEDGRPQSK